MDIMDLLIVFAILYVIYWLFKIAVLIISGVWRILFYKDTPEIIKTHYSDADAERDFRVMLNQIKDGCEEPPEIILRNQREEKFRKPHN